MIASSHKHGDLVVDFDASGWVQIARQTNGQALQLSQTEWVYILRLAELRGWPMAPPGQLLNPD